MTNDTVKKIISDSILSSDNQTNDGTFEQNMSDQNTRVNESISSPAERGSDSISGSTSNPASDDDVLKNAHQVGIGVDADFENPQELNIAKDVADAEEFRRTH